MLNGFLLQEKMQKLAKIKRSRSKYEKALKQIQETKEKLAENYKIRVDRFISTTNPEKLVIRDYDPLTNKTNRVRLERGGFTDRYRQSFVICGWKSERERIQDSLDKHRYFSSEPSLLHERDFPKILRTRDPHREIQPDMHFTAKTSLERVQDSLRTNQPFSFNSKYIGLNNEQKTHFQAVIAIVNHQGNSLRKHEKKEDSQKEMRRSSVPDLHRHLSLDKSKPRERFPPIASIDNSSPLNIEKIDLPNISQVPNPDSGKRIRPILKHGQSPPRPSKKLTISLPFQNSIPDSNPIFRTEEDERINQGRKLLQACRITNSPLSNTFHLSKGMGRLMGNFGKTNREVYHSVFHP